MPIRRDKAGVHRVAQLACTRCDSTAFHTGKQMVSTTLAWVCQMRSLCRLASACFC